MSIISRALIVSQAAKELGQSERWIMDNTRSSSFKKRSKVPKTGAKIEIKVKTNIGPGQATATQKIQYRRFWQNLLAITLNQQRKNRQ